MNVCKKPQSRRRDRKEEPDAEEREKRMREGKGRKEDIADTTCTGNLYKVVLRFGEFCSCCSLRVLPKFACSILATWERPYRDSL